MQSSEIVHRILLLFGERLALFFVIIAFFSVLFLESVHPAFSQEESYVGYSKNGLTYDFYLNSSYSESSYTEISLAVNNYSEENTINHIEFKEEINISGDVWDKIASCESGGNWGINTGNGYYGGLQFSQGAWNSVGGSGLPHEHSREEQISKGKLLQEKRGWGVWGLCAQKLGL